MTNIVVTGVTGRMGGRIAALAGERAGVRVVGATERPGHEKVGTDLGELTGAGKTGVVISDDLGAVIGAADVVVDFTSTAAALGHVRAAAGAGKAMVIGTTGFSRDELAAVREAGAGIPVVLAPNMSVGVNLLLKVLADVARVLGDDYDIEIIEAHHRLKKDAPSGTAMKMAQVIASAVDRDLEQVAVYARQGMIGERTRKEIGIQTIRAGDIVGEHTVIFGGLGERIEVTHKASSRDTFARGALKAAQWVHGRAAGLYDMQDVLGLK